MTGFGAKAYSKVSAETGARAADAHQLVLMLYDGAVEAARLALGHLQAGRVAQKAAALSRAARIVEEGLKVSLDRTAGGQIAQRLSDLYDFMILRLLQANLRNDAAALGEVIRLLEDLRAAWAQIGRLRCVDCRAARRPPGSARSRFRRGRGRCAAAPGGLGLNCNT